MINICFPVVARLRRALLVFLVLWISELSGAATVSVSFQQGVDGYYGTRDTWLQTRYGREHWNAGGTTALYTHGHAGTGDDNRRRETLIRFDGVFGPDGVLADIAAEDVVRATLTLTAFRANDLNNLRVFAFITPWEAGGKNNAPAGEGESTAARRFHRTAGNYAAGDYWGDGGSPVEFPTMADALGANHGADFIDAFGPVSYMSGGTRDVDGWPIDLNVTAAVRGWLDGSLENHGFWLRSHGSTWQYYELYSSLAANPEWRPRLTVELTTVPVELKAGYQFISSNLAPFARDLREDIFSDLIDRGTLDFVRDAAGRTMQRIAGQWLNPIGDWNPAEGYLVRMKADDSLIMKGTTIDPQTPLELKAGYQFIPYLPDYPLTARYAFKALQDAGLELVRDSTGRTLQRIAGQWVDGIDILRPGEGYLVKMNEPAVFIYPKEALPPRLWGEPGRRECMLATTPRWHAYDGTPLPDADISTHGPLVPAFPGAEGYGAYSFGGRGGKLYRVTNLNDSGPGSLREAVEAEGPRTVIFDVSGTINLESRITVYNPYLTIAGQTAPGDGITVAGRKFFVRTYDVIIRHMRFRMGDSHGLDEWTFRIGGGNHVIVDHVTLSWGIDGNLGVTQMDNATVQNSFLAKPLHDSIHPKGVRGLGALVRGRHGARYSLLGNLWVNHSNRVPRPGNYLSHTDDPHGLLMDFRNNVVYQGRGNNYDLDSITKYNFVNNYNLTNWYIVEYSPYSRGYLAGNYRGGQLVADQWSMISAYNGVTRAQHEQSVPFDPGPVTTLSAPQAWQRVIAEAGAWKRDSHDQYVIQEVLNYHRRVIEGGSEEYTLPGWWKTGYIDSQTEVGGLPELAELIMPEWIDSNRNGLPDWWETAQGLDGSDPDIAHTDSNGNGYTNLEDYLNDLDAIRTTHQMAGF